MSLPGYIPAQSRTAVLWGGLGRGTSLLSTNTKSHFNSVLCNNQERHLLARTTKNNHHQSIYLCGYIHLPMKINHSRLIRNTQSAKPTHLPSRHPLPGASCFVCHEFPVVFVDVVCCFTPQVGWMQLDTRSVVYFFSPKDHTSGSKLENVLWVQSIW